MKRRGISKRPVFLFSSCKCAVILQPRRESLTETGIAGWGGQKKLHHCVCCLGTKISFHAATKLCCICLQAKKKKVSCVEVWETNRGIALVRGCCTVCLKSLLFNTNTLNLPSQMLSEVLQSVKCFLVKPLMCGSREELKISTPLHEIVQAQLKPEHASCVFGGSFHLADH